MFELIEKGGSKIIPDDHPIDESIGVVLQWYPPPMRVDVMQSPD